MLYNSNTGRCTDKLTHSFMAGNIKLHLKKCTWLVEYGLHKRGTGHIVAEVWIIRDI